MIDKLEGLMNSLTDKDWGWWPLLFLRPKKEKNIDNIIIFKVDLLFSSILGLIFALGSYWRAKEINWINVVLSFIIGWILFFLLYKFTFAYFWNCRAKRLRKS